MSKTNGGSAFGVGDGAGVEVDAGTAEGVVVGVQAAARLRRTRPQAARRRRLALRRTTLAADLEPIT
jgi:hypothetical protein